LGKTFENVGPPLDTNYYYARITVSTRLGSKTTGFVGARYQRQTSDIIGSGYNEVAGLVGLTYTFQ